MLGKLWTNHSCFVSIFERGMSRLDLNGHEHSTARGVPFSCSSERSVVSLPQTDEKCILETVLLTVVCLTSISKLLYLQWDVCTCLLLKKNNWNKRLRWIRLHIDLVFWLAWKSLPCTSTSPPCSYSRFCGICYTMMWWPKPKVIETRANFLAGVARQHQQRQTH